LLGSFGLVYSYLTTNLSIDGTSNVKSARWDVHFQNIQVTSGSVEAETPVISEQTTINFSAILENPGDFYEFTVDLVNAGTLDSQINDINVSPQLTEEQSRYLEYRIYPVDEWQVNYLYVGETKKLCVRVEYLETSPEYYPTEDVNINFSITLGVVQTSFPKLNGTYYSYLQHSNSINAPIASISYTDSLTEAALNGNGNVFVKYTVSDGKIQSADIGLFKNNNYYYLKSGGSTYNNETHMYNWDSIYYEENKATLIDVYGIDKCRETIEEDYKQIVCLNNYNEYSGYADKRGSVYFGWCYIDGVGISCLPKTE
jgi:hypothetical protein